jgi:hypothetical protein
MDAIAKLRKHRRTCIQVCLCSMLMFYAHARCSCSILMLDTHTMDTCVHY